MSDDKNMAAMRAGSKMDISAPTAGTRVSGRRLPFYGPGEHPPLVGLLSPLRWIIPLILASIGVGYVLFEHLWVQGHSLSAPEIIRITIVTGVVGPTIVALILHWMMKIATAEAKAQQELAFRNRELAVLNAVGEVAAQSLNLDELLNTALKETVESMGLEAGEMRIVEHDQLVLRAHYGISQNLTQEQTVPLGECLCGRCARTGNTLKVNDLPTMPSLADLPCAREGFRSVITVPMKIKGKVHGVMLLASRNPHTIDLIDRQILTAIGYRVAACVENARLYQQAGRRALHLETASLAGQRMISLLDLNSLLAEVVSLIRDKFGYYQTHVFVVDEHTGEIVLKEADGPSADSIKARGLRFKIREEGITGWVAYTGQTLVCNDVSREPRYLAAELVPETQSELAVPLRVGNRIVGVLDVQGDRRDAFDKEDVTVLQILGNQVGIAIRNAQLFEETKHRYEAMIALHETSLDMIAQLDMTQLLQALLRRGAQLLGAQAGSLYLYDPERKMIYSAANYNTWQDWTGLTLRLGEGVVGRVIQSGKPLIENDYANWPGRAEVFNGSPQTRVVSAPLKWENRIIGGINIINDAQGRPFQENDLWLLTQFADLASIAVKNAELHTQVKEFSQDLEWKVEQRTEELSRAKDEIMLKAEQLRSLLAKTISIQEEERARIARDMHDGVIQLISAARFELQAAKTFVGSGEVTTAEEKLDTAHHVLEELEKEIRRAIYNLHPPILDAVGFAPALQKYVLSFQSLSGISCQVQVTGAPYRLSQATEIALFRMVQEALQNIAVHADAKRASIRVNYDPKLLGVTVEDNGIGFDYRQWVADRPNDHLGLLGMRERIENLGGQMELWSETGHGTRVLFQLPVA